MVGYFINPLVLRTRIEPGMTVAELLAHVRQTVLEALDHQDYPFALLVEQLQLVRNTSRSQLFQVMFIFQQAPMPGASELSALGVGAPGVSIEVNGLRLETVGIRQQTAQFDLTLVAAKTGAELGASIQYNTDLFNHGTIVSLAAHFQALLEAIAADAAQKAGRVPMLTAPEAQRILEGWNATGAAIAPVCVHELFEAQASRTPDAPALIFEDVAVTYGELNRRANQLAHALRGLGVRAEVPVGICLFYFASADSHGSDDKYRLLLEGARFADQHGFAAVWTPERHFHPFGGIFPNPAVTGAALAAITRHVQIRAGSVVLPLHHPIRVAEEWSVVDNLSRGRVGIAFASGWHADDFAFSPEHYPERKTVMYRGIETIRQLWRGEPVTVSSGTGQQRAVRLFPAPLQPELPIWITAAGSTDTFVEAGRIGANLLTHLLGQTLDEVAEKIRHYRAALLAGGHDRLAGRVTLMLHSFLDRDREASREKVREPFKDYLRSSIGLIANLVKNLHLPLDLERMTGQDMDELLEFAFTRYFETSALFGSPADGLAMVERLRAIGVDEVACLIDFGIDADIVLAHLRYLAELKAQANRPAPASFSLAAQTRRHRAAILQCTPSLLRLEATEHVLLLALHHIVADEWSVVVLLRELAAFYEADTAGRPAALPELAIQYADFASWERAWVQDSLIESQLAYWKRQLNGAATSLNLPTARPRPPQQTFHGRTLSAVFPASLAAALTALSREAGCTLFMTLLAAFKTLLHRYTGQDDLLVGSGLANRTHSETEALIGFFITTLVLRTDMSGDPTFRELLGRVRETCLGAYAHQDLPFEYLVEKLHTARAPGRTPFFQVIFDLQSTPMPRVTLSGLAMKRLEVEGATAKYDLTLLVWEVEQGLLGRLEYNTDLFDEAMMRRLLAQFEVLLHDIVARPDARINTLEMLTETERRQRQMERDAAKQSGLKKLQAFKPKAVNVVEGGLIKAAELYPGNPLPLVLQAAVNDLDLIEWAGQNREWIEGKLDRHGALLFRDFQIDTAVAFERFALTQCRELFKENGEHTPVTINGNIQTPVFYPPIASSCGTTKTPSTSTGR